MNLEISRECRKSVDQPRIQCVRVEVRIRPAAIDIVRMLEGDDRDAGIVNCRQPHVALADVEDRDRCGTRSTHLSTTTQTARVAQLNYHAVVLRFARDQRPMERRRRKGAFGARAAVIPLAFVGCRSRGDQFRRRQHFGENRCGRSAERRARDDSMGEGIGRRSRLDGSVRLRETLPGQTGRAGKALSRARARRRNGPISPTIAPSPAARAPPVSTRRSMRCCRSRTSITYIPIPSSHWRRRGTAKKSRAKFSAANWVGCSGNDRASIWACACAMRSALIRMLAASCLPATVS